MKCAGPVEGAIAVAYSQSLPSLAAPESILVVTRVLPLKIAAPLVLGIVASLSIAVYSELGYRRLEVANREMSVALEMQSTLHATLALVVDAESGQRGFLLTGRDDYLQPYVTSLPKIDGTFNTLRELLVMNGTASQRDALGRINNLVGKKLAEMEASILMYRKDGPEAAQRMVETGIGKRVMEQIRLEVDNMAATHRNQLDVATGRWTKDIEFSRIGMQSMTAFTVTLLLIVWLLASRDARQKEARRLTIQEDKRRLETVVKERTAALSELSNHLQDVREVEKSKLARDIHDELGGILVSAKMDVTWAQQHVQKTSPEVAAKLERALQALDDGVQIKRRIIEELRPTLLDNLGLSAALEWQIHEICDRAGLHCDITMPPMDDAIPPNVAIALYRIVQEALTNIVKYARAKHVVVDLGLASDALTLLIEDDGVGIAENAQDNRLSHGIAGMRQRVHALDGDFRIGRRTEGGTIIEVNAPLRPAHAPEPLQSAVETARSVGSGSA